MERRQRPAVNGTWDRPGYENDSASPPLRFRPEAPHFPPSRTGPQHGEGPPHVPYPGGGAQRTGPWESRPHHVPEHRPGYYGGQQRPEVFPYGGLPHHGPVEEGAPQSGLPLQPPNHVPNIPQHRPHEPPPGGGQYTTPTDGRGDILQGRPQHLIPQQSSQQSPDIYQSGGPPYNVQHQRGPLRVSDPHQEPVRSEGPPPTNKEQPDFYGHGGPSMFRGRDPMLFPYTGNQPIGFQPDRPQSRSIGLHKYQDDICQPSGHQEGPPPGMYHLKAPPRPDTYNYRVPSPGIQQYSTQAQPAQNTPQQGHYPAPPVQGNLPNPAYALPPPIGSVFSRPQEERDLEVPRSSSHPLLQGLEPFMPLGLTSGGLFEKDAPFPHREVPALRRDPNVPPQNSNPFVSQPSPHIEDRVMHFEKSGPSDKDIFVQWLSCFLSRQRQKPPTKPDVPKAASIGEARELIYGALSLVSQLDSLCQALESRNQAGEPWTGEYEKAADIQVDLEKRLKQLEKPGYIQGVKRKLDRVQKKRLRGQRRSQAAEEEAKVAAERSAEKEASIDLWRMRRIQEVEERKRERELKATADHVLAEVRKKQNDVKKMLDVLKSLEKLRKLRKEAAGRKASFFLGVCPPPSADEKFANHINRLRTMVHKRSALYDAEEKTLRVILEGEQEEERQREKDKRLKKEKEKTLQKQRELDTVLFGDTEPLPSLHPLLPFRQYYLQAEHSVVSLVQIRHEWDQFLVPPDHPDGSSIPRGWVIPAPPSNDTWATALKPSD
ncbi:hypothetical protein GDO81_009428 [Engystomops pustulosus]|uniref:Programmed cell death 7 n=1 Tax=Engystomops pustulosus TaxID=76066 RepID=A0AAV7BRR9_ENGPU|nr:hypothetical protein GDO81_009428 [Engystomops pustulosus]